MKPLVGDNVEIEVLDEEEKKGNIREILTRKNELIRPAVANIDQALVVFAVTTSEVRGPHSPDTAFPCDDGAKEDPGNLMF